jgi:hypothetical protein
MSYWAFFPAEEGWGRMPVWGFAEVAASEHPDVETGRRIYGYFPASTHLVVRPERVREEGFVDATPHRAELPPLYNQYLFTDADPGYDPAREAEQMLLRPLFATAFLLDDDIAENEFGGAETVVLSSASSKTALATAFLVGRREGGPEVVGLTSPSRVGFVEATGVYDRVLSYDDLGSLGDGRAVYLEFSGNAEVRGAVHRHFGDRLARSVLIGVTHWEEVGGSSDLPGPTPAFFFAPDRAGKRTKDWGGAGLRERMAGSWLPFVEWTESWLEISRSEGLEALESAYLEMLDGNVDPAAGRVFELPL